MNSMKYLLQNHIFIIPFLWGALAFVGSCNKAGNIVSPDSSISDISVVSDGSDGLTQEIPQDLLADKDTEFRFGDINRHRLNRNGLPHFKMLRNISQYTCNYC